MGSDASFQTQPGVSQRGRGGGGSCPVAFLQVGVFMGVPLIICSWFVLLLNEVLSDDESGDCPASVPRSVAALTFHQAHK